MYNILSYFFFFCLSRTTFFCSTIIFVSFVQWYLAKARVGEHHMSHIIANAPLPPSFSSGIVPRKTINNNNMFRIWRETDDGLEIHHMSPLFFLLNLTLLGWPVCIIYTTHPMLCEVIIIIFLSKFPTNFYLCNIYFCSSPSCHT